MTNMWINTTQVWTACIETQTWRGTFYLSCSFHRLSQYILYRPSSTLHGWESEQNTQWKRHSQQKAKKKTTKTEGLHLHLHLFHFSTRNPFLKFLKVPEGGKIIHEAHSCSLQDIQKIRTNLSKKKKKHSFSWTYLSPICWWWFSLFSIFFKSKSIKEHISIPVYIVHMYSACNVLCVI